MKLELNSYTKFVLTVIAVALLLNAVAPFVVHSIYATPVNAGSGPLEVKIVDFRSIYPQQVKITNLPNTFLPGR